MSRLVGIVFGVFAALTACVTSSEKVAQEELSARGINWEDKKAVSKAVKAGDVGVLDLVLKARGGLSPAARSGEQQQFTIVLVEAARAGNEKVVRRILQEQLEPAYLGKLLESTLWAPWRPGSTCAHRSSVAALLEAGARVSAQFQFAPTPSGDRRDVLSMPGVPPATSGCADTLALVLQKQPEVGVAIEGQLSEVLEKLANGEGFGSLKKESALPNAAANAKVVRTSLHGACLSANKPACAAEAHLSSQLGDTDAKLAQRDQKQKAEHAAAEWQHSPDGLKRRACAVLETIAAHEKRLVEIGEIERIGRIVKVRDRNTLATAIHILKQDYAATGDDFKRVTGQPFNEASCKVAH